MKIVAAMATYPDRLKQVGSAMASILPQVDKLYLVANDCSPLNFEGKIDDGVDILYPETDLKDTGKFTQEFSPDDYVLCCDDDILYPEDYVPTLIAAYERFEGLNPVVGVHGVIYSDVFDGSMGSRVVYPFFDALQTSLFVNQLGTGTILCRGSQMPPFSVMENAKGYCDIRFACFCQEKNFPRICIDRHASWLKQLPVKQSLFDSFSNNWSISIIREAQAVAGFGKLPSADLLRSVGLP